MTQSENLQAAMACRDSLEDGPWMVLVILACKEHEPMDLASRQLEAAHE